MLRNDLKLDGLVGQLTTFELRNYDNNMVTMGNSLKSSLTIKNSKKEKKIKEESEFKIEDDLDEIEALLARKLSSGKGKFSLIYFEYNKIDHFVARCCN